MNVGDLKAFLEEFDDEVEVRFASQPAWPFEYSIADVIFVDSNIPEPNEDGEIDLEKYYEEDDTNNIIYLVEGQQLGYLPSAVKEVIGW